MIRVGFLGTGFIADVHRSMLGATKEPHRITHVFDTDGSRAVSFASACGAEACASAEAVLDEVDAVLVCTWTSEHPPLVRLAASRGIHVFCEKPLATDLAAATVMHEAVANAGVVHQAGLILRSLPTFRLLRSLVAEPEAGRAMSFVFRDDQLMPIGGMYGSDWRADPRRAGSGTLLEHSIHDLDIVECLLGTVTALRATTRTFHAHAGIEDLAVVSLDIGHDCTGTLTSVWHQVDTRPSLRRLEIFCERAWFALENDMEGPLRIARSGETEETLDAAAISEQAKVRGIGFSNPMTRFLRAIRTGERGDPDFAVALRAHVLADAAYRSAAADAARISTS